MSKQLYEEALADVKKLKEVAEDNAKKALIEAVSPRIKDLIEAELLREFDENESSKDDLLLDDGLEAADAFTSAGMAVAMSDHADDYKSFSSVVPTKDSEETYELNNESVKVLEPLVNKLAETSAMRIESKLFQLGESVEKLFEASLTVKKSADFQRKIFEMVSEIEKTYEHLQESAGNLQGKEAYEGKLETLYKKLNKLVEQDDMKKKLNSLNEAELTLKLTNVPDELEDALEDLNVELVAGGGEEEESEEGEEEELDLGGEEEESEEGEEEELDLGGEEEEKEEEKAEEAQKMESRRLSDNLVVEIDENMLRREIARMRSLREAADDVQSWGHGPGEVSSEEDFEADDLGDPFVDVDLTTEGEEDDKLSKEMDELDQMYQQDELDHQDEMDQMDQMDELDQAGDHPSAVGPGGATNAEKRRTRNPGMPQEMAEMVDEEDDDMKKQYDEADADDKKEVQEESIRRRLTREARVQTEAKKKAVAAKKKQAEAKKKAKMKEQQAQASAKKGQKRSATSQKSEARKCEAIARQAGEAYAYYANIFNESVRRAGKLQTMLAEANMSRGDNHNGTPDRSTAESENLRKKLAETNLFNTKLLYSNKLLQNESLTKRQKAEIIERLDEAASEREVKLVYESLVKALGSDARPMVESAQRRVLGSSSQATRPASTALNESYEADRWAKLAGLK